MGARHPLVMILILAAMVACGRAQAVTLRVSGDPAEEVVVMLSARKISGAKCDVGKGPGKWAVRWATTGADSVAGVDLGNIESGCVLDVAIFSERHAMFLKRLKNWNTGNDETRSVSLQPLLRIPISIWVASSSASCANDGLPHEHIANANLLYRQNKTGIRFHPVCTDVSANASAVAVINDGIEIVADESPCANIEQVKRKGAVGASPYYTRNSLNVYYIDKALRGRNCAIKHAPKKDECPTVMSSPKYPKANGNITYVGTDADLATLAHELGHAFGLRPAACGGHADETGVLSNDNIMWPQFPPTRFRFSLGQSFRMNTQKDRWGGSMLIENGSRPRADRRVCPPPADTVRCPAIDTDWRDPPARQTLKKWLEDRYDDLVAQGQADQTFAIASNKDDFVNRYLGGFPPDFEVSATRARVAGGGADTSRRLAARSSPTASGGAGR